MSICRAGMKILVSIDGSEHAEQALNTAVEMAKKFGGKLTLLHVVPSPIAKPGADFGDETYQIMTRAGSAVEELLSEEGSRILADAETKAKAEGVQVETLLKNGHVVDEILKVCKAGTFDLVVMGARGMSSIKELILGSVSHGVIKHTTIPVLVTRTR